MLALFLLVVLLVAAFAGLSGYRCAERYEAQTGEKARGWEPWKWGLYWFLAAAPGGRAFDKATGGWATQNSRWYRRVARVGFLGGSKTN
jgi:hypothetical protein